MTPREEEVHDHVVPPDFPGDMRLDRYVADVWKLLGRSQLKQRCTLARVNGKAAKLSNPLGPGDKVHIELSALPALEIEPSPMDIDILYEDDDVLVVNKAPGVVVHPAAGNREGTLVHGILFHAREMADQGFEDDTRPGIVHRLDKDTSGVLIIAKNPESLAFLSGQFHDRLTRKTYLCVVEGTTPKPRFSVEGFLRRDPKHRQRFAWHQSEGKSALTEFSVLDSSGRFHLLMARPHTGRTHQIRVHCVHSGLPIVGDEVYFRGKTASMAVRCMLHAYRLEITLPGRSVPTVFEAPLPVDFVGCMERLGLTLPKTP